MKTPSLHKSIESVILDKKAANFASQRTEDFFKNVVGIINNTGLPLNDNTINLVSDLLMRSQNDYMNLLNSWKEMQEGKANGHPTSNNDESVTEATSHGS